MSSPKCDEAGHIARLCFAETVGTFLLALMACMGTMDPDAPLLQKAFVVGFALAIIAQGFGHISGAHVNPSITVAAVVYGSLPIYLAPYYIVSQCLGALLASVVLPYYTSIYPMTSAICVSAPHPDVTPLQATVIEMTVTSMLILLCCSVWHPKNANNTDSTPIKFFILIGLVKLAAAPLTGAAMNPAAVFGPAVWNNYWDNHWVYWVGPISGALITSSIYRLLFPYKPPSHEEVPKW